MTPRSLLGSPTRTALALLLTACATGAPPPPRMDAGVDAGRRDAGSRRDAAPDLDAPDPLDAPEPFDAAPDLDAPAPFDAGLDAALVLDAGTDAGARDAGRDAGPTDAGRDAPVTTVPPTIDGVLGPDEWLGAAFASDTTTTIWAGNELRAMRVLVLGGALYLAVEGRIQGGNALVVYVDRNLDEAAGVSLASLTDATGALDSAVTADLATPATFRPDLAFGTLDLSRAAAASDERMGWRDFLRAASPSDLFWITAATAPVACSATACETRIGLSDLGGASPRRIGLFARIVNADGSQSPNQTLPSDDPATPRTVRAFLEVRE